MQLPAKQMQLALQLAMHFPAEKQPGLQPFAHLCKPMWNETLKPCAATRVFFSATFPVLSRLFASALSRSLSRRTSLLRHLFSQSPSISISLLSMFVDLFINILCVLSYTSYSKLLLFYFSRRSVGRTEVTSKLNQNFSHWWVYQNLLAMGLRACTFIARGAPLEEPSLIPSFARHHTAKHLFKCTQLLRFSMSWNFKSTWMLVSVSKTLTVSKPKETFFS